MPGTPTLEAFNAKARQSTAGSRKKGKVKKSQTNSSFSRDVVAESDPNAEILAQKSQKDKDQEKKEKLLRELAVHSESKWTSKKKRRLEKYIEKKLKKEERVLIFERLTQTQASIIPSLLHSSSTLGTGIPLTHTEIQQRAEDRLCTTAQVKHKRKRHLDTHGSEDDETDPLDGEQLKFPSSLWTQTGENEVVMGPVCSESTHPHIAVPSEGFKGKKSVRGWGKRMTTQKEPDSDTSSDSSISGYRSPIGKKTDGSESDEDDENENPANESKHDFSRIGLEAQGPKKKRSLGFKEWARNQLSLAKGGATVSQGVLIDGEEPAQPASKKRNFEQSNHVLHGPLGEELELPTTSFTRQVLNAQKDSSGTCCRAVEVKRPPDIENARVLLPIVAEEQPIVEAVLLNPVVILCGETGSGKTTQVPQFLYEVGFGVPGSENPGIIGITQPRRVAAVSMAKRVAHELSLTSSHVSYQIRYDATVSPYTSIKFMTDGILLRELATDFLLTKYSIVIIDEAHERSINTDILIGVLSRVIRLREELWKQKKDNVKPLRLIIMSATLRVTDFAENQTLFSSPPPIINIATRQHPVTIHFSRRTHSDYVTQAIKKTIKIHTQLPPGGILIFLTGQNEIIGVCRKLEARFGQKVIEERQRRRGRQHSAIAHKTSLPVFETVALTQTPLEVEDVELDHSSMDDGVIVDVDDDTGVDDEILESDDDEQIDQDLGLEDFSDQPMHVVPLYSLLPGDEQMHAFQPPPPGCRLVVVSTNIAETSLTIPGIRYVVDCGRAKERRHDVATGVQTFRVSWISKASAAQRAGRAGRTGPGHCYRLYSAALFEHHFDAFSTPEIQRTPVEGIVLQMKSMHIDAVVNFPFPTPLDRQTLYKAEKTLTYLGALTPHNALTGTGGHITDLGCAMSLFPLSPRFSRLLVTGQQHGCLPYVISIVSALSVGDPFIYEEALEQVGNREVDETIEYLAGLKCEKTSAMEARRLLRKAFYECQHKHASLGKYTSDIFKFLSVSGAYDYAGGGPNFCSENFVRPKAMEEIHKLKAQISNIMLANFPGTEVHFKPRLGPPNDLQLKVLRQILTAGFLDQVAVRKDVVEKNESSMQYKTSKGVPYRVLGVAEDAYLHPSSILINHPPPEYLTFNEIVQTSRVFLKGLTIINPVWLSTLGKGTLCTFSKPVKNNIGVLMTIPKFGPDGWELPAIKASIVLDKEISCINE